MPSHLLSTSRIHASFANLWLKWLLGLLAPAYFARTLSSGFIDVRVSLHMRLYYPVLLASNIATSCAARPGFNYDPAQGMPLLNAYVRN